jgi:hypothetical protein
VDGRGGILEFFLVMTTLALVVAAADVSVGVVIGVAVAARSMGNVGKVVVGLAFRGGVRSRLGRVRVDCRRPIVDAAAG